MAARLAPHLSHKSALALLLPSDLVAPIEAVRRAHDKNFNRWPPHINLIYPFLASPSELAPTPQQGADVRDTASTRLKHDIRRRIENAVKDVDPIQFTLMADSPGIFHHSKKSKTVWLAPSSDSVRRLQLALQTEFSECDADSRPFTPHLSVGQARSEAGAQELRDEIKKSVLEHCKSLPQNPIDLDWFVDKVFVIERKGFHGRFNVVDAIELVRE